MDKINILAHLAGPKQETFLRKMDRFNGQPEFFPEARGQRKYGFKEKD
jgi:hypothetical protein